MAGRVVVVARRVVVTRRVDVVVSGRVVVVVSGCVVVVLADCVVVVCESPPCCFREPFLFFVILRETFTFTILIIDNKV